MSALLNGPSGAASLSGIDDSFVGARYIVEASHVVIDDDDDAEAELRRKKMMRKNIDRAFCGIEQYLRRANDKDFISKTVNNR